MAFSGLVLNNNLHVTIFFFFFSTDAHHKFLWSLLEKKRRKGVRRCVWSWYNRSCDNFFPFGTYIRVKYTLKQECRKELDFVHGEMIGLLDVFLIWSCYDLM